MTEQLSRDSAATAPGRSQLFPGYLLTPLGWAATPLTLVVSAYPTLLADLFGMTKERMHLIALALAHLEAPSSLDMASLLISGSPQQVLHCVLGRCPTGVKRALKHLPTEVLRQQSYRLLIELLDDPDAAKILHHADQIDDMAIRVLADLPQKLRKPLASALPDWSRKLNGLTDGLQFLVSHGVGSNVDELIAQLATVTAWPQLAAMVEFWVGRFLCRKLFLQRGFLTRGVSTRVTRFVRLPEYGAIVSPAIPVPSTLATVPSISGRMRRDLPPVSPGAMAG